MKKSYNLELEFVAGNDEQAEELAKLLETVANNFKSFCEQRHEGNEVEFEVFLNDYEGVQEALRSVEK